MADNLDEKVSALVDGELPHEEAESLLNGLRHDLTGQMCWRHYHLISDALKNNLPDKISEDFVNRISIALESEPLLSTPPRRNFKVQPFIRPTIGFALAASVAVVAFVGLGWNSQTGIEQVPPLASNTSPNVSSSPTPITVVSAQPTVSYTKVHGRQWDVERPEVISKLNDYLVSHDQYSSLDGMHIGVLPQVRIVGYERSENSQENNLPVDGR
jgi:sigma-E factor negative regulatory protein RseA